ncbi:MULTISPECIES: MFS transporter [unclassified Alistipes]|jgi:FHS family L-fucose permease-like MFS transporter|uniref:MFS transporter n=1 Tax=unclassified Alistipes TaxID=2608932 RepID=UPI000B3AED7A|nr:MULTISPECIES: MFS transporter [unclassified Alistipes]OUO23272.1 MFS transporter [Alistipes sp. An31A]HIV32210.1 MFS transporter [Candidatus Alistipes excrementigallinarum]
MEQKKSYILPIIMMFALFAMISFVTGLTNPLGVIVKHQFALPNWMSQLGNAANFIAYFFMGLPAGLMLKRIGYKKTALAAIAVGFIGVGVQFLAGRTGSGDGTSFAPFYVYLVGAFISGFSMCMLNTVVNPMLNTLGGGGKRGNQLIQFGGSLNSISATIVPVLVGYLMGDVAKARLSDAAPALFIAMGIFAVAFIVLWLMQIPEPYALEEKKDANDKYGPMSFRHFVLGTVAIFIYVGVEVGIPNFINLFLTSARDGASGAVGMGLDTAIAGSVVGTYWFLMMCGRLLGGLVGAKVSSRVQIAFVSALAIIFVLIGIFAPTTATVSMPVFRSDISFGLASVPVGVVFFVLCGLCTSVMWGGLFNLAVEGLGKYTSVGSGIFMVMVCGGGILPLIQGYVADLAGYLASYWVIILCLCYILYYALVGSKNVNKDIPVD